MSLEPMKRITQAEEEARELVAEARQMAREKLTRAEAQAAGERQAAKRQGEERAVTALRAAEADAAAWASELMQSTENKCAAMRVRAGARMEETAAYILGKAMGR